MKRILTLAVMVAFVLGTAAGVRAEDTIKIGAIFSVTGPASFIGDPEKKTVDMLVEKINASGGVLGKKLEVIVYDSETNPNKAVTAANRLLKKDKVVAVIGPSLSGNSMAVKKIFEKAKMPLFSAAAADVIVKPVSKYIFKSAQDNNLAAQKLLADAKAKGYKKIAIISVSDGFGQNGRQALQKQIPANGMTIVADEVFGKKDPDMTAQLTKIRAANPDAIFCWGVNPGPAIVARNIAQLGIKSQVYMSHGVASPKFMELAGDAANGVIITAGWLIVANQMKDGAHKKMLQAYTADFEKMTGGKISSFGGHAWDALMMVVKAIEMGKSTKADDIVANLEKLSSFQGIHGTFRLSKDDHNGLDVSTFALVKIEKGQFALAE